MEYDELIEYKNIGLALENIDRHFYSMQALEELSTIKYNTLKEFENVINLVVGVHLRTNNNASLEAFGDSYEYNTKTVSFILQEMSKVDRWINKSISHIVENIDKNIDVVNNLLKVLGKGDISPINAKFTSDTLVRNLNVNGRVNNTSLPNELKKFFNATKFIEQTITSTTFNNILTYLEKFELTGNNDSDKKMLPGLLELLYTHFKTITPVEANPTTLGLRESNQRKFLISKQKYLGSRIFYTYVPTQMGNNSSDIFSGIIKYGHDKLDVKQQLSYLTKPQMTQLLNIVLENLKSHDSISELPKVNTRLLEIAKTLTIKYRKAKIERKSGVNAKEYILALNIANSLLYGLQQKSVAQDDSVTRSIIRFVDVSMKASSPSKE